MKFDFRVMGQNNADIIIDRLDTAIDMQSLSSATDMVLKLCKDGKIKSCVQYTFEAGRVYRLIEIEVKE